MHLVLYQPEIPPNTGAVARQCVGMGATLHVVGPCRFDFSDRALRRAGLDYWPSLSLRLHDSPEAFLQWLGARRPWLVTKRGSLRYDRAPYRRGDAIILGNETRGLPAEWTDFWRERTVRIPILGNVRSYNLACSASIVLAQAMATSGAFDAAEPAAATEPTPRSG